MNPIGGVGAQYGGGAGPAMGRGGGVGVSTRFAELLEQLRREYDGVTSEKKTVRTIQEGYQRKVEEQLREMNAMESALHELDRKHTMMKEQYEAEISRLKAQLPRDHTLDLPPNLHPPPPPPRPAPVTAPVKPQPQQVIVNPAANPAPQMPAYASQVAGMYAVRSTVPPSQMAQQHAASMSMGSGGVYNVGVDAQNRGYGTVGVAPGSQEMSRDMNMAAVPPEVHVQAPPPVSRAPQPGGP